jgi:hypothetical protein
MQKMISILCCIVIFLQSCSRITENKVSETANGPFKVVVRTQEFNNSGSLIVTACVTNSTSQDFPEKAFQCFLEGYDFTDLSVAWRGPSVIEIFFRSGRVERFANSAVAYPGGSTPKEFHIFLCDGCEPSKDTRTGGVKHEPANGSSPSH